MTEAEKTLAALNNPDVRTVLTEGELLTIKKALQDAGKYNELQTMFKGFGAGEITDPLEAIKWLKLAYENLVRHAPEKAKSFNSDETGVKL